MKKTFLIAGLIAGLTATNGYAVQSGTITVECKCPEGCKCRAYTRPNGEQLFRCECLDFREPEPTPTFDIIHTMVANQDTGVIQQSQINKPIKQKKVSARVAEMPKVTKKIVYEEIISDDDAE